MPASSPVPLCLGLLFINTPFVLLQLVMQYLYYGGAESLLIKNNEIMEVRDIYLIAVGAMLTDLCTVHPRAQGHWARPEHSCKSQQCLTQSAQALCSPAGDWETLQDLLRGKAGVTKIWNQFPAA